MRAYYTTSSVSITGYTSDRYTQLISGMASEPDDARRKELYSQMNDLLLDEPVTMVMAPNAMRVASHAKVQGVRWRINEVRAWEELWLAPEFHRMDIHEIACSTRLDKAA